MVEVLIDYLGDKGDGIAHHQGERIFVDRALAGEKTDIKIYRTKEGTKRGEILSLLSPSPFRQKPPCPHYENCGGCQMQHTTNKFYKTWKTDTIKKLLQENLSAENLAPDFEFLSPVFGKEKSRRRVSFSVLKQGGNITIGFHKRRSDKINPIDGCLVVLPELLSLKEQINPYLTPLLLEGKTYDLFLQKVENEHSYSFDCVITGKKPKQDLTFHEAIATLLQNTQIDRLAWKERELDKPEILLEKNPLLKKMGALRVPLPPFAFLQPSHEGEEILIQSVLGAINLENKKCADLFAGNGTFTGALLEKGFDVSAFESESDAVLALKKAGHGKSFFRDLFKNPLSAEELNKFDCIVLDPPRAGAKKQCEILSHSAVKQIIYISCNPAQFIKEALLLVEGAYHLKSLRLIDQFVWSTHSEVVACFERKT